MKPSFADTTSFSWSDLGDTAVGRPHLGSEVSVVVYRLALYSLREAIAARHGEEAAAQVFRDGGWIAGREFCRNTWTPPWRRRISSTSCRRRSPRGGSGFFASSRWTSPP
jgi:hypothetical protein